MSLDERFSEVDRHLGNVLAQARRSTRHLGVRGNELTGELGKVVERHFVECASHYENYEVQDAQQHRSDEVDLVFLNRFHPAFLLEDRPRAIYIEGVLAAAEVKASLDKGKVADCLKKAQAFKRLVASVEGKDLQAHNVDSGDWHRYLLRRPFFAFAYEDKRELGVLRRNIEDWVSENDVPDTEQIDAFFVLNRGVILNLGNGAGAIELHDNASGAVRGFVAKALQPVTLELMLWLSRVAPSFISLHPILLRYSPFSTDGYTKLGPSIGPTPRNSASGSARMPSRRR